MQLVTTPVAVLPAYVIMNYLGMAHTAMVAIAIPLQLTLNCTLIVVFFLFYVAGVGPLISITAPSNLQTYSSLFRGTL